MLYKDYFQKIRSILDKVEETQSGNIEAAAAIISDSIKSGGLLHVFGCGHSQMYAMEVFYRAGGMVPVNPILTPMVSLTPKAPLSTAGERIPGVAKHILDSETIGEKDVMFIASTSARNALPVEMAMEAKKRGLKVIVLIASAHADAVSSRHASGKKAHEFADVVLDNCGVLGDAVMQIEGLNEKFGPTSSVIGFTILQSVIVQTVENLVKNKQTVEIWVSANTDAGDAHNKKYIEKYRGIISSL